MKYKASKLYWLGFESSGVWSLKNNSLEYSLIKYSNEKNILYAFVIDNSIKYIGKTTRTLKTRMNEHKKPGPKQKTCIRINKNLLGVLRQGMQVKILVFKKKKSYLYKRIDINLAAGLEDPLIAMIKPCWNLTGK